MYHSLQHLDLARDKAEQPRSRPASTAAWRRALLRLLVSNGDRLTASLACSASGDGNRQVPKPGQTGATASQAKRADNACGSTHPALQASIDAEDTSCVA